jgi:hypothetical protein
MNSVYLQCNHFYRQTTSGSFRCTLCGDELGLKPKQTTTLDDKLVESVNFDMRKAIKKLEQLKLDYGKFPPNYISTEIYVLETMVESFEDFIKRKKLKQNKKEMK